MNDKIRMRRKRLYTIIKAVPATQLTNSSWGQMRTGHASMGCILGWAASDPVFRAEGLRLISVIGSVTMSLHDDPRKVKGCRDYGGLIQLEPVFDHHYGVAAGRFFFGLTMPQASRMFGSDRPPFTTKKDLLAELKQFLADSQPRKV